MLHAWEREYGQSFPWNLASGALDWLPEPQVWAISNSGQALLALTKDGAIHQCRVRDDGGVNVMRWPSSRGQLIIGVEWGQTTSGRAGETTRPTIWSFRYREGPEPEAEWESIEGVVTISHQGVQHHERLDGRETFARALAGATGWDVSASRGLPTT